MTTVSSGSTRMTADMTELERLLAQTDQAAAVLAGDYRVAAESVFKRAAQLWPVRTGRSKSGLRMAAGIDPNGVIYARIWHEAQPGDDYTRFVKVVNQTSVRIVMMSLESPNTSSTRVFVKALTGSVIPQESVRALRNRARRGPPKTLFALTHLLRVPWSRDVVPYLTRRTEELLAESLGAR